MIRLWRQESPLVFSHAILQLDRDADGDVEDVTVGDSLAQVLDADANITARCDLPQLETVTADDFPENLILPTSSSDGLETDLFNEIEIVSDDGNLRLDLSANIQTSIGRDVGA